MRHSGRGDGAQRATSFNFQFPSHWDLLCNGSTSSKEQREKASYDSSFATQRGIDQFTMTDAKEFVTKIQEVLEERLGEDFLKEV